MSKSVPYNKKHRIYVRDRGYCHYCGVVCNAFPNKGRHSRDATLDHIVTKAEGGDNTYENLILACFDCNNGRNCLPYDVFMGEQLWRREKRDRLRDLVRTFSISIQLKISISEVKPREVR